MKTDNWHIVYDALSGAQYLISNEIQCIIDENETNTESTIFLFIKV